MSVNRRKKSSRHHGSHTHGRGFKHYQGSGHRGGRGMAGRGKRADHKRPSIYNEPDYFGKFGFIKYNQKEIIAVNLQYIELNLEKFLEKKLISKENDAYIIDLEKLGYNKLLGYGKLTKKMKIKAPFFSKQAVEKLKKSGGEAIKIKKVMKMTAEKKPEVNKTEVKKEIPKEKIKEIKK